MLGGAISWLSQKQLKQNICTLLLKKQFIYVSCLLTVNAKLPIKILEDNQSAIAMAKNPVGHKRTTHVT